MMTTDREKLIIKIMSIGNDNGYRINEYFACQLASLLIDNQDTRANDKLILECRDKAVEAVNSHTVIKFFADDTEYIEAHKVTKAITKALTPTEDSDE